MTNETTFVCSQCSITIDADDPREFDGYHFCPDCLTRHTRICRHCGARIWADENAGDSITPLCQSCYDRHYTSCSRCNRIIHEEDARYEDDLSDEPLCEDCYDRLSGAVIHDYYYKPAPIFFGSGNRFFGVELEIDNGGEDTDSATRLLDIANTEDTQRLYIKHDGSLDDGMELVTHPMTLDYHLREMPWQELTEQAVKLGYTSHIARTCGLHVHVNRSAFGETESAQEASISRILYFVEKHWNELLCFSRRTRASWTSGRGGTGIKTTPRRCWSISKRDGPTATPASTLQMTRRSSFASSEGH